MRAGHTPRFNPQLGHRLLCDLGVAPEALTFSLLISKMRVIPSASQLGHNQLRYMVVLALRHASWRPARWARGAGAPRSQLLSSPVKLCHGQAALHLQKVLHAGLRAGPAVHQHHGGRAAREYRPSPAPRPGNPSSVFPRSCLSRPRLGSVRAAPSSVLRLSALPLAHRAPGGCIAAPRDPAAHPGPAWTQGP